MIGGWFPWNFFIRRAARAYGVIDPVQFLARLRRFSQPSEVQEPIELLRAGIQFHARGLINTKAIQYNLDWVWPFWVARQFNPADPSFIPRGFSFSHVNLTHRNWTAVGHPGVAAYPVVDPRGLVTPLHDGWSLDFWAVDPQGAALFPSRLDIVRQRLVTEGPLTVETECRQASLDIRSRVFVEMRDGLAEMVARVAGTGKNGGRLVVALRPYNPEGIQFIEKIRWDGSANCLRVESDDAVMLDSPPERVLFSNYRSGDVALQLNAPRETGDGVDCDIGMATAAALFPMMPDEPTAVEIRVPLRETNLPAPSVVKRIGLKGLGEKRSAGGEAWTDAVAETATFTAPDPKMRFLYDAAVRTLLLLSAEDLVPGPYTYRRFWFRDACLMLNGLLAIGLTERSRKIIAAFPARQKRSGYFQSQQGEWDSNGQVLWIMDRFQRLTRTPLDENRAASVVKGAEWIARKRLPASGDAPHAGLLPAGFSAEHLGPNDYYFWDDFWGLAGLKAAARLAKGFQSVQRGETFERQAAAFERRIFECIAAIPAQRRKGGIPASPYRRMDAGAVGSLVADYPLQITDALDTRIQRTADFLMANCFQKGAFFQDMIHSGINAYLTLAIAQTLLRNNDTRYRELIRTTADLASPTGQWPEAIHPHTLGGCMGDGQHGWAAAEWIMMMRNLFIREEHDQVILGAGVFQEWLDSGEPLAFGPTPTPAGRMTVTLQQPRGADGIQVDLDTSPFPNQESLTVAVPGYVRKTIPNKSGTYRVHPAA